MLIFAIVFITLLTICSILLLLYPYIKQKLARKEFFSHAYRIAYNIAMDKDYYLINNVELAIDKKVIHFDHILFGEKYIYCIGNNFRKGALSGKFSDLQWFSYLKNGKTEHIKNPLMLHNTRLEYLKSAINADDLLIGICVVNDDCLLDEVKDAPENIVMLNQKDLRNYIIKKEKSNVMPIDSIQLDSLVHLIYRMSNESKKEVKE